MNLKNKKILVCVSGGIAAYKACEFVRELIKSDAEVRVAMTKSATKFVSVLTFESLTNHEVTHEMFADKFVATRHIDWADWADLLVFIPATANTIAKLAHGFSDDIISTIALAHRGPKLIAPAMNTNMWHNPIVQENIETLKRHGFIVMGTSVGDLACGWVGEGRLAELQHIMEFVFYALSAKFLTKKNILINAGPTLENIDPVRFISNYSSGKMGYALAKAAWALGANVTLISGPTQIQPPYEVNNIFVTSADEMFKMTQKHFKTADIFIASAAVADYRVKHIEKNKIKKKDESMSLELIKNVDILKELASIKKKQIVAGFALETDNAISNAKSKLKAKNLDYIILNELNQNNAAFASDQNTIRIISAKNEEIKFDSKAKTELAFDILNIIGKHGK